VSQHASVVVCLRNDGVASDPLDETSLHGRQGESRNVPPSVTPTVTTFQAQGTHKILTRGSIAAAAPAASFKSRYRKCLGINTALSPTIAGRVTSDER
jgi:hypothetical protein